VGRKRLNIVAGDTCFLKHEQHNIACEKCECRQWFDNEDSQNCVILAAKKGPQKQERIGQYFGLTRMRVCQIEKGILAKVREQKKLDALRD
jgi:hypothetical protein